MIALTLIFVGSILLLVNALLFKNVVIEYDEKHSHFLKKITTMFSNNSNPRKNFVKDLI